MQRRALLMSCVGGLAAVAAPAAQSAAARENTAPPRALQFPRDFGAHPEARIEWWYVTGTLTPAGAVAADRRRWGFQVTFFRAATGIAADQPSRFAARQLIFAHAAVSDLQARHLQHDQRIARSGFGIAGAAEDDTRVNLRDWRLTRTPVAGSDASRYLAQVASDSAGFRLDLQLQTTQPVLLQGEAGFSQKGPDRAQASRYYSQPQLAVEGSLLQGKQTQQVQGRAWLDHEWSDSVIAPQAVGWDWIGMNLDDGSALTAFRLRRADGSALYAGGSVRHAGQPVRAFAADAVHFTPGRTWESSASRARYPVEWCIETPAGRFQVKAMLDNQELDSRNSTGAIYWEGLSELFDASGQLVGRGYLELTGYAGALRL